MMDRDSITQTAARAPGVERLDPIARALPRIVPDESRSTGWKQLARRTMAGLFF